MNREEFVPTIVEPEFKGIIEVFNRKNQSYGKADDLFHNFRNTAQRVFGSTSYDNMYKVLLVYVDKHEVALANRGLDDAEFVERTKDIILYHLLALALYNDKNLADTDSVQKSCVNSFRARTKS